MTKYILTLLMLFSISITAQVKNDTIKKEKEPEEITEKVKKVKDDEKPKALYGLRKTKIRNKRT